MEILLIYVLFYKICEFGFLKKSYLNDFYYCFVILIKVKGMFNLVEIINNFVGFLI